AELHVHLDKLEHAWVTYKGILAQMRMAISADWAGSGDLEAEMAVSMLAASEALLTPAKISSTHWFTIPRTCKTPSCGKSTPSSGRRCWCCCWPGPSSARRC